MTAMADWSNEQCLALIDLYKQYPVLWNPKDIWYNSKNKKVEAWEAIAEQLEVDVKIVRQKMLSLLGSFRAQKSKGRRTIDTGKGKRDVYMSRWFAFERMQFLLDREMPKNNLKIETETSDGGDDWDITVECDPFASASADDDIFLTQTDQPDLIEISEVNSHVEESELSETNKEHVFQSAAKRAKRSKEDRNMGESFKLSRDLNFRYASLNTRDSFAVYGQHIANKLRTYSRRTQFITEHMINNVLFVADMGHYDNMNCTCYLRTDFTNCNAHSDVISSFASEYKISPTPVPSVSNAIDSTSSVKVTSASDMTASSSLFELKTEEGNKSSDVDLSDQ